MLKIQPVIQRKFSVLFPGYTKADGYGIKQKNPDKNLPGF